MKKEIADIIKAAASAEKAGKRTVLATVVHVEGSSYRRPGARMLVTEDGQMVGAISGGCLEGDALRKALLAIRENKTKLITYDTSDEDDAKIGVQLGCNGIVHILFEPVTYSNPQNPVSLLRKLTDGRRKGVLTVGFNLYDKKGIQPGTFSLFADQMNVVDEEFEMPVFPLLKSEIQQVYEAEESTISGFPYKGQQFACFHEFITPPISLVIFGAGNDVIPLVDMAAMLGWTTHVVDGRPSYATQARFPNASQVVVARPAEALQTILADEFTVFVLMSHNYNYDLEALRLLAAIDTRYIGVLGPKKKLERMLGELQDRNVIIEAEQEFKIYGPVGLDIGAETAEEIALSIVSEIKAVFSKRRSVHLRDKNAPIHSVTYDLSVKLKE